MAQPCMYLHTLVDTIAQAGCLVEGLNGHVKKVMMPLNAVDVSTRYCEVAASCN